ncbi:MAG: hypothetical protein O2917_06335, partial [Acidobacteria bacterium]|nr:hypothetical protein [Acidobacteriota bacterium]
IKITVIATGFDQARNATAPMAQSAITTPIDLTAYSAHRILEEERKVVNGAPLSALRPALSVSRRPGLDLPSAVPPPPSSASDRVGTDRGALSLDALDDDASPLDVPAFLRRQEG